MQYPTIITLCGLLCRPRLRQELTPKIKIGLTFLLINIPFGYLGVAAGAFLRTVTGQKAWIEVGVAMYAMSWLMLGLGIFLAGLPLAKLLRQRQKKIFLVWRRQRRIARKQPLSTEQ